MSSETLNKIDLDALFQAQGFSSWGVVTQPMPQTIAHYEQWLAEERHAGMDYLKNHLAQKANPQQVLPQLQTALMATVSYVPHPHPSPLTAKLPVARYAKGDDYHDWLTYRLQTVVTALQNRFPEASFWLRTDSGPVLERDLAVQAGLGWIGKNTCLIHPQRGSYFFIGEIYTSLQIKDSPPSVVPDRCGTCTRCLEACPTQALIAPRVLDARRCISYWTIETQAIPPVELRQNFADQFFGCDICQQVCPWNEKAIRINKVIMPSIEKQQLIAELKFILVNSNKVLMQHFKGSPLERARGHGLKRNALIFIGNQKLKELVAWVTPLSEHPRLAELAQWCLKQLL